MSGYTKIVDTKNFKEFFKQFLITALWSTSDDGDSGDFLDELYDIDDFTEIGLDILRSHALSFYARSFIVAKIEKNKDPSDLGHDFWLTACGHGAGFWDGDWPSCGKLLDSIAEDYDFLRHIDLKEFLIN